jgi:hypothetical protein
MHWASAPVESAFAMPVSSNERPLETTTIRLRRDAGMLCCALVRWRRAAASGRLHHMSAMERPRFDRTRGMA